VAVTELDTSAFVQSYRNKYMARKMEGIWEISTNGWQKYAGK
jgi:hypothetical protein